MKINTPRIPIRLPTNSTVSFRSACNGAKMKASMTPTIIIGIPTPTEICFEAISLGSGKNLYEFYAIVYTDVIDVIFNPKTDKCVYFI